MAAARGHDRRDDGLDVGLDGGLAASVLREVGWIAAARRDDANGAEGAGSGLFPGIGPSEGPALARVARSLRAEARPTGRPVAAAAAAVILAFFATTFLHDAAFRGSLPTPMRSGGAVIGPAADGSGPRGVDAMNRNQILAAVAGAGISAAGTMAQDAVQWRVQDGGNGHWYQKVSAQHTWDSARLIAQERGGHLATITSKGEQDFIASIGAAEHWLGGSAPANQGCGTASWVWVTGEPMTYLGWAPGEPGTCSHTCMAFAIWGGYTGRWNNDNCSRPDAPGFMLEWSADCNGDGIVDYGQIRAGQLRDLNQNNIPDICEAGFVSSSVWGGDAAPIVPLRDIDMGEGLAVGIKPDGTLVRWGSYSVAPPAGVFTSFSAGRNCAIAIRADGVLIPFGANDYGRLDVPAGTFKRVSAADATWHAGAIRLDGTVVCWGYNNHGQANAPTGTFLEIAAGGHNGWSGFTAAIRTNGSIAAWGNNTWGQLAVPSGSNFRKIAAGYYHALAVRSDNTLAGWGWNASGQASVPAGQFVDVSCGSNESIALRVDGTVVTFGSVPASVVTSLSGRTHVVKAQITCCEGLVVLESVDCDDNGVLDAVEIWQSPSLDAASNGVLDACEPCLADIDGNGEVNGIDLAIILDKWGTDGGKDYPNADIDGDGTVAGPDLSQVLSGWGPCQ